jgi:hypothetical protein
MVSGKFMCGALQQASLNCSYEISGHLYKESDASSSDALLCKGYAIVCKRNL